MNSKFPFIAVDWGTTRMRAMLCFAENMSLDYDAIVEGPGISRLEQPPGETLFKSVKPWVQKHGKLDVLLGGMAGSNIGWRETPYLACPQSLAELCEHLVRFEEQGHRVAIVPGLSCTNAIGQPDVMRGEETQVLGWRMRSNDHARGDQLLCLPGTHTKWVQLSNDRIRRFTTSLTGELFDLLRRYSVLVSKEAAGESRPFDESAFRSGVDLARHYGGDLLHAVFTTRSRKLVGGHEKDDASSYLSGLLIGADVRSAIRANPAGRTAVHLVGSPQLCERFAMAIEQLGYTSESTDGSEAVYAGFLAIANGDRQ